MLRYTVVMRVSSFPSAGARWLAAVVAYWCVDVVTVLYGAVGLSTEPFGFVSLFSGRVSLTLGSFFSSRRLNINVCVMVYVYIMDYGFNYTR